MQYCSNGAGLPGSTAGDARFFLLGLRGRGDARQRAWSGLQIVFNVEREGCHHLRCCALIAGLAHPAKGQDTVFCGYGKDVGEGAKSFAVIFVKGDALHRLTSELDYRRDFVRFCALPPERSLDGAPMFVVG